VPLVGVVDPSHSTSERDKGMPGVLPPWVTVEESLERVQASVKWAPWTFELLSAMYAEFQERGDRITSSALVSACPRAEVMKRKADYVDELSNIYVPFRGTMVHRTMEYHADENAIAEARFYTTIDGIQVSCSPDLLSTTVLDDYKVTETPPMYNYPYVHHKEQVEFNAYVARHAEKWDLPKGRTSLPFDPREHPVKAVRVIYLGPKFVKVLVIEKKEEVFDGKTGKFKKTQVPFVWPDKLVLKVFRPRLHIFKNALDSYPEWPEPWVDVEDINKKTGEPRVYTAEELWGGEPEWRCPGPPICNLPNCMARRHVNRLMWPKGGTKR